METYKAGQGGLTRLTSWVGLLLVTFLGCVELYSWIQNPKQDTPIFGINLELFWNLPIIGVPLSWKLLLCLAVFVGLIWAVRRYLMLEAPGIPVFIDSRASTLYEDDFAADYFSRYGVPYIDEWRARADLVFSGEIWSRFKQRENANHYEQYAFEHAAIYSAFTGHKLDLFDQDCLLWAAVRQVITTGISQMCAASFNLPKKYS